MHSGSTRRDWLAQGALALSAGALLAGRGAARAQEFRQTPLVPEAARLDPLDPFWDRLRGEFPLADGILYFDTAGLGIPPFEVLERMQAVALDAAARGETLRDEHLEPARAAVARLLSADPDEIALVRNATEAMNLVARGLALKRGDEVVLTTHEPPGAAAPWVALAQETGVVLRLYDPVFDPQRDLEGALRLVGRRTRVVVMSHVLATTGAVMPVRELCQETRRRGSWCVIDGAQAAGILPVSVHDLGADVYLASGHQWLLGPPETGFLYVRRERLPELRACFAGAYVEADQGYDLDRAHLEFKASAARFEYGTRSPSQAAGLASAIGWLEAVGPDLVRARATALAQRLHAGVATLPGIEVLTPAAAVAEAPIVSFRVVRRPNTQVADWLQRELGMRVHLVAERGANAVRASTHLGNSVHDVDWLIEAVRVLGA